MFYSAAGQQVRSAIGALQQVTVYVLAALCIWNYSHDLFWGLATAIGSLAPLVLMLQNRAATRARNAAIEASWHAAYRDEELKQSKEQGK
jgi:hypothetical protein